MSLQFYSSHFDATLNGEATGSFDLSQGGDANYATCSRCLVLSQDPEGDTADKSFFPRSGTLVVNATSTQIDGNVKATLTDVTLLEVTLDEHTNASTPVAGGACLHLASADVSYTTPAPPAGWKCKGTFYDDGYCDCGCGVRDVDCVDGTVDACDSCNDPGSCSAKDCPGMIDPANNAVCMAAAR